MARSMGMAKPMPIDPPLLVKIDELTPITSPRALTSGPPEFPVDPEKGDVANGVFADQFRRVLVPMGEGDDDLLGVIDHVVVGDDESIGAYDEPGAVPLHQALRTARQKPVVEQGPRGDPLVRGHRYRHDGRAHAGDGIDDGGPARGVEVRRGGGDGRGLGRDRIGRYLKTVAGITATDRQGDTQERHAPECSPHWADSKYQRSE
jgi:hypothetical protein